MAMASTQAMPEPMNATPHHSKVKVSLSFADATFVAGTHVSGKMEMECRADKGLGIGVMMVELFAVQGIYYNIRLCCLPLISRSRFRIVLARPLSDVRFLIQQTIVPRPQSPTIKCCPGPPHTRVPCAPTALSPSTARPLYFPLPNSHTRVLAIRY